jgi:hypothetical protein
MKNKFLRNLGLAGIVTATLLTAGEGGDKKRGMTEISAPAAPCSQHGISGGIPFRYVENAVPFIVQNNSYSCVPTAMCIKMEERNYFEFPDLEFPDRANWIKEFSRIFRRNAVVDHGYNMRNRAPELNWEKVGPALRQTADEFDIVLSYVPFTQQVNNGDNFANICGAMASGYNIANIRTSEWYHAFSVNSASSNGIGDDFTCQLIVRDPDNPFLSATIITDDEGVIIDGGSSYTEIPSDGDAKVSEVGTLIM